MSPAEKKSYFGFDMAKNVNFELSGDEFFMMSISKIMVPLQSPSFLLYVVKLAIVLMTTVITITGDLELDPDVTANLAALRREFDQTVSNLQYYEVS